jgi:long-chain acyl-CoA synthetase
MMQELIYHRLFMPAHEANADREGYVDGPVRHTFGEHAERVFKLCDALGKLGISRSDRFAVMALNSHQFEELWHASFLGAGVINPLNLRLAPKELAYILSDSGSEVAFVDMHFAPLLAAARAADPSCPIRTVVLIGGGDVPHDLSYEDLISSAEAKVPSEPHETDPAVLMYTGGTTGLPKGVLLTNRAEMLNLYHVLMVLHLGRDDVGLAQTPMFHAASVSGLLGVPAVGGKLVIMGMFDPGGVMTLIEAEQVTQTVMVPTMLGMMMNHPEYKPERLASMRKLTYGASPMPTALLNRALTDMPDVEWTQGYGMTECCAVLTILRAPDHVIGGDKLASAGQPVPGVTLCVRDDEGNTLPAGSIGEVHARGGHFMNEYWKKPESTAEVFTDDGWYATGDAGYLDADGYLFLVDRVKDMIVTGGENVYCAEVESVISVHPSVAQVAVIGIPDDKWGEAVHAIVVLHPDTAATGEELIALARESIAGFKVPKSVEFRAEPLPLSGAMKVLKRELRAPYWDGKERLVN